ncbi:hypothetical protein V2A60_008194 [Cordyceps javanica]
MPKLPDKSELQLLNGLILEYLEERVLPHLTEAEREEFENGYKEHVKFRVSSESCRLVTSFKEDEWPESALDAILAQALCGREQMMKYEWFACMYELHGDRLDMAPRERHPEFAKIEAAIFGKTSRYEPHREAAKSNLTGRSTHDLLAALGAKIDEINDTETKQHTELEDIFTALAVPYPGVKGVLCGVRNSFCGQSDRCAERTAFLRAISEYIAEAE